MDIEKYRKRKAEYAKNPEQRKKRTEYMRIWREKNRERHNELARQSHQRNKHKHKAKVIDAHLKRSYGIDSIEKAKMVMAQLNKCLICDAEFKNSRVTHVDHCHTSGKIRGILCSRCNGALGWFEKYSQAIKEYL